MEERWKLTGGRLVAEKRREKKVTRVPCTVSLESPSRQLASSRLSITSLHRQHQHHSSSVLSFSCLHLQVSMNNSEDSQNSSLTLYVLQSMAGIMIILTLHAVTMVELLPIFKKAYWSLAAAGFVYVCFVFSMTYPDVQRLYALRALWQSHQTTDDAL